MQFYSFIILAFLSYALAKSTRQYQPKGKFEKLSSTIKHNSENDPPLQGGNQDSQKPIETLFIPEDPNQYEEILSYVRKLLQESTSTFDNDELQNSENGAKERTHKEESADLYKDEALNERSKISKNNRESTEENTSQEDLIDASKDVENKFLKRKFLHKEERNSSFEKIFENEEIYLSRDSDGILTKKIAEISDDNSETSKLAEEEIRDGSKRDPDDEDLLEAANFGLQAMHDLYHVKEPTLYSMGLYLETDNPARFVASFNDQTEEARALAKYDFAVLQSTARFTKKFPDAPKRLLLSRRNQRNPLQRHCPNRGVPDCPRASLRYRTSDGSCNNLQNLWWGSAMSTMQRFLKPVYQDGIQSIRRSKTGEPLPSPRDVTSIIHANKDVPLAAITHMLMQWGQFVDHDLTATGQSRGFNGTIPQCCLNGGAGSQPPEFSHPECLPIIVNPQDSFFGPLGVRCLEFLRSGTAPREDCEFGPREQLSQVTSYLDASMVYSSNAFQSDTLRLFRNGLLQYGKIQSRRPLLPRRDSDLCRRGSLSTSCFRAGDGRLSEQPALTSLHVVFLRLHNRIATKLAALNSHWSDEKLFQETRRIVGAVVQHITYREFLPIILGQDVMKIFDLEILKKAYYDGYDPEVNPNIANGFSTAAYRFGHSLVQRSFVRYDSHHQPMFNNVSIHDEFGNPENLESVGSVDRLLLGLINQPSQRRDEFISDELTNHLFQTPRFPFGMDLASLNIQRGRDHGIPPYVKWREPCGLSAIRSFDDMTKVMSPAAVEKFRLLYSSVEDIDLFPAGLAENSVSGGLVGTTFACIIGQQFSNLRRGDRFWYENSGSESSFTPGQLQQIRRTTLAQVLCTTMDGIETLQPFVFLIQDSLRNQRVSCSDTIIGQLDLEFWAEKPPEPRSREDNVEKKSNRKNNHQFKATTVPTTAKGQNNLRLGGGLKGQQKILIPQRTKPVKANIHQHNRIVVKKPLGPSDNVTIVVQNNAVNSPVFVNDAIYGSHIRIQPTTEYQTTTQRPILGFVEEHRPMIQDNFQSIPGFPMYNSVKPIVMFNQRPSGRPTYVPYGYEDPSNPNPLHHGYQSVNYPPNDVVFESLSMTSPRPTLYTYYTSFQQRPTPKPQMDTYPVKYRPQNHEQSYITAKPSTNSWSNLEPNYELHDQSPTKPTYGTVGNSQLHNDDGNKPDNWQKLQQQYRPFNQQNDPGNWNSQSYQNGPIDQQSQQSGLGNWNSGQYRPANRPHHYDDFHAYQEMIKEKLPSMGMTNQNEYTTWSSVLSYQSSALDRVNDKRNPETSNKPSYPISSNTSPFETNLNGWPTIPSYQNNSSRPSNYHDTENWSNPSSYKPEFTSKPSTHGGPYAVYDKRPTVMPIIVQSGSNKYSSTPHELGNKSPTQSSLYDMPYHSSTPTARPVANGFNEFQSATYERPNNNRPSNQNGNRGQYYSAGSVERPAILETDSASGSFYKPLGRPSNTANDRFSDNTFYQRPIRPELSEIQAYKTEENLYSKPPKVHSVTIVTEPVEQVSQSAYQVDITQNRVTSELPKPLASQLKNDQFGNKRPGQYYYEKNVLHRYPDKFEHQTAEHNPYLTKENVEQRHKVISDVEELSSTSVINVTKINSSTANEFDNGERRSNGKRKTAEDDSDENGSDVNHNLEDILSEEISMKGITSNQRASNWLNPQEDPRLPSTMDMPRIVSEEVSTAKELPRPIKLRSHAS